VEIHPTLQPNLPLRSRWQIEQMQFHSRAIAHWIFKITTKPDNTPVTDADRAVEQAIRDAISRQLILLTQ
jgi:fructose-1,6-bisphosphatase/inositol monophosphatase family enzyme